MISVLHRPERRCAIVVVAPPVYEAGTAFVWDAVGGATSYVLQVGSVTTLSDVYNADVGNVITKTLDLAAGTYFWRVVPQGAGSVTVEREVVIP